MKIIVEKAIIPMLIKATAYQHQIKAFNFLCEKFGLIEAAEETAENRGRISQNLKDIKKEAYRPSN